MTEQELLSQLDDDQRAAVTAPLANNLCVANAGSGKTRVLTYRIAYWILKGQPEASFLMLTFTNKAASEMMDRICKLLGKDKLAITGGTFHSVASRLLRKYGTMIGVPHGFSILDQTDATDLMGVCREQFCAELGYDRTKFPVKKAGLLSFYSYCRNCRLTPQEANFQWETFSPYILEQVADILFPAYEARKESIHALDFDDLLLYFDKLLQQPQFQDHIHRVYPNVFVDEYQDINAVQDSIIHRLTEGVNQLTAVGDEAQCIYGFRGSEVEFIKDFPRAYPSATVYPIRNNYRSVKGVVDLATDVINQSPYYENHKKVMLATQQGAQKPKIEEAFDDMEQAQLILHEIMAAQQRGIPYQEMAILFRTNFLARAIEAKLTAAGIPVRMECSIGFYEREHIKNILDFLKFINNPQNEIAFWNLFETVDGIGPKTAQKMFRTFTGKGCDISQLSALKVPGKACEGFSRILDAIEGARKTADLQEQLSIFLNLYFDERMEVLFPEDHQKRKKDLPILKDTLRMFKDMEEFLDNAALNSAEKKSSGDCVLITTVHKAKGLEWDKVILPYMNAGIFPYQKSVGNEKSQEEERRLLYVAITRARKELTMIQVRYSEMAPSPTLSPFLSDVMEHGGACRSSA